MNPSACYVTHTNMQEYMFNMDCKIYNMFRECPSKANQGVEIDENHRIIYAKCKSLKGKRD